jgi:hypothetical protein
VPNKSFKANKNTKKAHESTTVGVELGKDEEKEESGKTTLACSER